MWKRYKVGMVIGRFQPFHHGHECIIARALEECEKVIVLIGSAQESRLPHNPLTAQERIDMISNCFAKELNQLIFIPLEDRKEVVNDQSWGEYMINEIEHQTGLTPQVVYEGREKSRKDWYDTIEDIDIIQINRMDEPYSATNMRKALLEDNSKLFYAWCANSTEGWYEYLRRIMLDVIKDKSSN